MKRLYLHGHAPDLSAHKAAVIAGYMKAIDSKRYIKPSTDVIYMLDVVSPRTLGLSVLTEYEGKRLKSPTNAEFRQEFDRIVSELKCLQRRQLGLGEIRAKERYYSK